MNRLKSQTPLSNEQIQRVAPSAFAGQPYEKQSDRYAFVPTSAVIDGMRNHGFLPYSASQSLSRIAGKEFFTKHQIRFRAADTRVEAVGDTFVELALTNSHDGTSTYELSMGMERLACLNGMLVSEGLVQSLKVRHTGNIIDRVIEGTEGMIEHAPVLIETIKTWRTIELTQGEQKIFAESALRLRFEDGSPVAAERLLTVRRTADQRNDLWTVFNRIQENTVRGGLRYNAPVLNADNVQVDVRRNRTREVKGIDQSNRLNRELFSLAEKMAELKRK